MTLIDASGHAAALPSAASNSRRPMVTVIRPLPREVRKSKDTTRRACCPNSAAPCAGGAHARHRLQRSASRPRLPAWFQEIYFRPRRFTSSRTCGTMLTRAVSF